MAGLWLPGVNYTTCSDRNVSYSHRVDDPESYDWCIVPDSGYDGVLFAGVALLAACCLQGRFSALWILLAGATSQAVAFPINTGRWGNALAIWLGITPADLFLYVFLPPMLVDAAVRISYFHFRKLLLHVISFAFLMVLASTFIMVPVLLYFFKLNKQGWEWQHAALFAATLASTDAVAVGAILKAGGSVPERLILILEGESLFNDATSITLFEIMLDLVNKLGQPSGKGFAMQSLEVGYKICWLTVGGLISGLVFGFLTRQILKLIKRGGHNAPEQLSLSLAMAYLVFYISQVVGFSGVIAVVVFGLYGSASAKWNMSSSVTESPVFSSFWDTLGFILNGIVFFYAGASSVNFFWRSSEELYMSEGSLHVLLITFWRLPLIYLAMLLIRCICICLLNPIFRLAGSHMSAGEIVFSTAGGLRGAISLILAQMLVTQLSPNPQQKDQQRVIAQIALWTAGVVTLTLLINAPLLPILIRWTGLAEVSPVKATMRARAARALVRYSKAAIHDLQHDEDEMLRGVDWNTVRKEVEMSDKLKHVLHGVPPPEDQATKLPRGGIWRFLHWLSCCCGLRESEESKLLLPLLAASRDASFAGGSSTDDEDQDDSAGRPRERLVDADALWENTSSIRPRRSKSQSIPSPGQFLGAGAYFDLHKPSMVADLPFSRALSGEQGRARKEAALQGIDVDGSPSSGTPVERDAVMGPHRKQPPVSAFSEQPAPGALETRRSRESDGRQGGGARWAAPQIGTALGAITSDEEEVSEEEAWAPELWEGESLAVGGAPPSPRFRGTIKRDSAGNSYTILPQPVLKPKMVKPEEETAVVQQPNMRWMTVDLAEYRKQQQRESVQTARDQRATPRSLLARPSMHARTSASDSKMLKRAMSGPFGPPAASREGPPSATAAPEVAEARIRLVAGLKRYFHGKRAEGLLSARGVQLLDYACHLQMDDADRPLFMFGLIEREVCGDLKVRLLSRALFTLRRCGVFMRGWQPRLLWEPLLQAPLRSICRVMASSLSSSMLMALEVAVEYWLALSWSPQAQWLAESETSSVLQHEVKLQRQQVWKFIINREIEAPARFQAIQTYRAAMAVLRQQQHFVEQLVTSGVIDEQEEALLLTPLQRQERHLQRRGPHWRSPSITEVLRNLAFLANLPRTFFDAIVSQGLLLRFGQNEVIWEPPEPADDEDAVSGGAPCERSGIFIVIAGLISRTFKDADGNTEELLMGSGGVFGLTSALIGESLPGSGPAVAIGNALSQGPVVFHWPQHVIDDIESKAALGMSNWCQLNLDLHRMAALFIVERVKSEVLTAAVTHYQALALAKTRRRALRRLLKKYDASWPKAKAGQLWLRVKEEEGARKLIGKELDKVLDSLLPEEDDDFGEDESEESKDGGLAKAAVDGYLLTDQDILSCMDAEKLWRRIRKLAGAALAVLKEQVRDAGLVQLDAHEVIEQRSSIVLLKGTIHTAGMASYLPPEANRRSSKGAGNAAEGLNAKSGGSEEDLSALARGNGAENEPTTSQGGGAGGGKADEQPCAWEVTVAYKGPSVLPWLWRDVTQGGEVVLKPQAIPFRAGPEGAVLVVCEPEGGPGSSPEDSPTRGRSVRNDADLVHSISRPSLSLGRFSMQPQGIPDREPQVRFAEPAAPAWQQQPLAEGAEAETFGDSGPAPTAYERGRCKQLRVMSIRPV